MKDALDMTYEVSNLAKYSPKQDSSLKKLQKTLAADRPGFRVLSPNRWTVGADSLKMSCRQICHFARLKFKYLICQSIKARTIGDNSGPSGICLVFK